MSLADDIKKHQEEVLTEKENAKNYLKAILSKSNEQEKMQVFDAMKQTIKKDMVKKSQTSGFYRLRGIWAGASIRFSSNKIFSGSSVVSHNDYINIRDYFKSHGLNLSEIRDMKIFDGTTNSYLEYEHIYHGLGRGCTDQILKRNEFLFKIDVKRKLFSKKYEIYDIELSDELRELYEYIMKECRKEGISIKPCIQFEQGNIDLDETPYYFNTLFDLDNHDEHFAIISNGKEFSKSHENYLFYPYMGLYYSYHI